MATVTRAKAVNKLRDSIAKAALRGNKIQPGSFGEREYDLIDYESKPYGHVCLCGAVLVAAGIPLNEIEEGSDRTPDGDAIIKLVAKKLGITIGQAASLNNGFEYDGDWGYAIEKGENVVGTNDLVFGENGLKGNRTWFNIGRKLREQYDEGQKAAV